MKSLFLGDPNAWSRNKYFVLHFLVNKFSGAKLSSIRDVFSTFLRIHIKENIKVHEFAAQTIIDLNPIRVGKAIITVRPEQHAIISN